MKSMDWLYVGIGSTTLKRLLTMSRVFCSAQYGDTLDAAAQRAIAERASLKDLLTRRGGPGLSFDFFGLQLPLTNETTAEDLVAEVCATQLERAEFYANTAIPNDAFEYEHTGPVGEYLDDCVLKSVQCGQRWGNITLQGHGADAFLQLRHVFEFNGIRIPFNPWKEGETQRVLAEARRALEGMADSFLYVQAPLALAA